MKTFNGPECSVSYQNEKYISVTISKFFQKTAIIERTLKPSQVQKHTGLKICNTPALPWGN